MGVVKDVAKRAVTRSTGKGGFEGANLGAIPEWQKEGAASDLIKEEALSQKEETARKKQEALIQEQEDAIEKRRLEDKAITDERVSRMKGYSLLSGSETGTQSLELLS